MKILYEPTVKSKKNKSISNRECFSKYPNGELPCMFCEDNANCQIRTKESKDER